MSADLVQFASILILDLKFATVLLFSEHLALFYELTH